MKRRGNGEAAGAAERGFMATQGLLSSKEWEAAHFCSSPIKPLKCQLSHVIVKRVKGSSQDKPAANTSKTKRAAALSRQDGVGRVRGTAPASGDPPALPAKAGKMKTNPCLAPDVPLHPTAMSLPRRHKRAGRAELAWGGRVGTAGEMLHVQLSPFPPSRWGCRSFFPTLHVLWGGTGHGQCQGWPSFTAGLAG